MSPLLMSSDCSPVALEPLAQGASMMSQRVVVDGGFQIATSLEHVLDAWGLVYEVYRRAGLINANPWKLHIVRQAISPNTVVALRREQGEAATTVSAYADSAKGLPLDSVYSQELNAFRRSGRRLVEVGMLAEMHSCQGNSFAEIADLMRFPFYFALHSGSDDLVIGVHPHHVRFYERLFGFEQAGPPRTYPMVKDHPVVLLRLDVQTAWNLSRKPKGARRCADNPVSGEKFERRFRFAADDIFGTPLAGYMSGVLQEVA